jgi:hypothetical protein
VPSSSRSWAAARRRRPIAVRVDDVLEQRRDGCHRAVLPEIRPPCGGLAGSLDQVAAAVVDRHEHVLRGDHVEGVVDRVVGAGLRARPQHDEHAQVAERLELLAVVALAERGADQAVPAERLAERVELLRARIGHVDPEDRRGLGRLHRAAERPHVDLAERRVTSRPVLEHPQHPGPFAAGATDPAPATSGADRQGRTDLPQASASW